MSRRAVLYCRVSSAEQAMADRNSLQAQRAAFRDHCTAHDYTPSTVYEDIESGRRAGRARYQAMLEDARRHDFDVLVVSFLDRLGRDQWELMARLGELRGLGIDVEAVYESSDEFIYVALGAWKAEQESKRIGERVKLTSALAVRRGVPMGRAAFGFRKVVDIDEAGRRHGFRLIPDPQAAPVVRDIFTTYASGNESLIQIARRLTQSGIASATGRQWSSEAIRELLRRPVYVGDFIWADTLIRDAHEPLVDREVWQVAQARLKVKAQLPAGRTQHSPYLLSGVFYCGHCGSRQEGNTTSPRGYSYRRYRCAAYRKSRNCQKPNYHAAEPVEQAVIAALDEILGDLHLLRDSTTATVGRLRSELEALETRLATVDDRFMRNMRLFESGVIATEDQLATANRDLADEQRRMEAEAGRIRDDLTSAEQRFAALENWPSRTETFASHLQTLSPPERKALVQQLVSRAEICDGETVPRITLRMPL